MPLRFNCEQCDVKIKVPDGSEGKKVKCPSCGHAQRVQVEVPAVAAPRAVPSRPVVATSATPPKAMDRPATEPVRPRRQEQRPAAAAPVAEEPAEVEEIIEEEDALSALASAAAGETAIERDPETKLVPPAARLPRAPRDTRQGRGRSQGRRGRADGPGIGGSDSHAHADAVERSESNARPNAEPVADPVSETPRDTSVDDGRDDEVAAAADSDTEIDATSRVLAERTAEENAALMAFLSEPDPAPAPPVVASSAATNVGVDAVKSHAVTAVGPLPEESTFSAAMAEVPAPSEDDIDANERDGSGSGTTSPAVSERIEQVITSTLASANLPAVGEATAADRETSVGATAEAPAAGGDESPSTVVAVAAATSPAPAGGSDGDNEAPAGEVRDLFDDFVRREEAERQAELAKEKKRRAAEGKREAKEGSESPVQPTPVVVVKTVPPPVRRGGVKSQETAGAMADAAMGSGSSSAAAAVTQSASSSATVAVAPAAAPRSPQAIPLASPAPVAAPPATPVAAAPSMKLAAVAPAADDEAQVNPIARLSSASAAPSAAPSPHLEPPPAYALLLVLCWMLRMLACLSVVSVTKLLLVWSDAGASAFEVLVVLPLGLGVAAAIWGVGEVARVVRDAARGGPHR